MQTSKLVKFNMTKISNEGYVVMKVKIIALIMVLTAFNPLLAKDKEEQKSWEYYDAEKIKIVRTHRLTTEGIYRWPRWSPDGKKISADSRGLQIFEFKENGKEIEKIGEITDIFGNNNYAWSPDGKSIVYSAKEESSGLLLRLVKIGKEKGKLKIVSNERLTTNGGIDPTWSPDGSKIVFSWGKNLVIINSDGTNRRVLMEGEKIWEPKFVGNDEILYLKGSIEAEIKPRMFRPRDTRHLFKINIRTTEEIALFPKEIIQDFSVVLPTMYKCKIYCVTKYGEKEYVVNLDMTEKNVLPSDDEMGLSSFSPDGSKFIDVKMEFEHDAAVASEIYVMNTNGTGLRQLTNTANIIENDVKWSPDGEWLLYVDQAENSIYVSKLTRRSD